MLPIMPNTGDCLAGVGNRACVAELEGKRAAKECAEGDESLCTNDKDEDVGETSCWLEEKPKAAEKAVFE
jgi:hypothetical protein